jgi:hypothetical protein
MIQARNWTVERKIIFFVASIAILNLAYFILETHKELVFHSDSATIQLLAVEMIRSGHFFPPDWVYVNNDLWILFGHIINIPFVMAFGPSYLAYASASLLASAALLQSVWLLCGLMQMQLERKLLVIAIVASGVSLRTTEIIFGSGAYGTVIFISIYLVYFYCKAQVTKGLQQLVFNIAFAFIAILVVWANPQRALVFYIMPLYFSSLVALANSSERVSKEYKTGVIKIIKFTVIILLSLLVGYVLHTETTRKVLMQPGYAYLNYDAIENISRNINQVITLVLRFYGGEPVPGRSLLTVSGIYDSFRLIIAGGCILLNIIALGIVAKKYKSYSYDIKIIIAFAIISLVEIAFIQSVTTTVRHSNYLTPSLLLLMVVSVKAFEAIPSGLVARTLLVMVMLGFVSNAIAINTRYWYSFNLLAGGGGPTEDPHLTGTTKALLEWLEKHKLTYGYAPYWNAGYMTVLSDYKVIVRPIDFRDGLPVPRYWASATNWYLPNTEIDRSFILVNSKNVQLVDIDKLKNLGINLQEIKFFEEYAILVFNENIANKLIFWKDFRTIRY